jgi:hypothetical protein
VNGQQGLVQKTRKLLSSKGFSMNRFFSLTTAVVVALAGGQVASAGTGKMGSHPHHGSHHGRMHSYSGKYNHNWGHSYWNSRYGCYTYWSPSSHCYYYWCSPASCYYPVTYCPYKTYVFEKPVNYATGVPVVTTPVVEVAAATATASATATATASASASAGAQRGE